MRGKSPAAVVFVLLALAAVAASADGIIIIYPPYPYPYPYPWPWPYPPYWRGEAPERVHYIDIKYHHVRVDIDGGVATTYVDEVFSNPHSKDLEGTYVFPLPAGASVDRFSLKVDGVPVEGEMLSAEEAAATYRDLVRQNRDPALLEYVGREAFRFRIYPIPALGEKRIEISYSEVLPYDGGTVRYEYPLDTERFSVKPLEDVDVTVRIRAEDGVKGVYSPTHEVDVETDDGATVVRHRAEDVWPDRDLVLYYSPGREDMGANLITYEPDGEDGYFLMLITPPATPDEKAGPKDITFVVDTSGSMGGEAIEQVKDALAYCVERLASDDRFNVVAFSDTVRSFRKAPVPITKANVREALEFVGALEAAGGTNINDALISALGFETTPGRAAMVVFLTDGKPTVGEKDASDIITNATEANERARARIFVFGVGYKVNTDLLDGLSRENGGLTRYVEPREDIELAITSFYEKVASPVLSDVAIRWGGDVYDVYPPRVLDVFFGTQVVVTGRYRGPAPTDITISGTKAGKGVGYSFVGSRVTRSGGDNAFVARLWAARKIGYLLDEIKAAGEDEELVREVVALSKKYGIVTPYTSYLVEETAPKTADVGRPKAWRDAPGALEERAGWLAGGTDYAARGPAGVPAPVWSAVRTEGELAVKESVVIGGMKEASKTSPAAGPGLIYAGDKAFARENGAWVDLSIGADRGSHETVEIKFGSDDYFQLVAEKPELAAYLALGERVEFLWNGRIYRIYS